MEYYVYENWTRDRGRIHEATCSFCNHGKGKGGNNGTNDKWHGPFDREAAFVTAKSFGRADMRPCGICDP